MGDAEDLTSHSWVWLTSGATVITIQRDTDAQPRNIKPLGFPGVLSMVVGSPDGRQLAFSTYTDERDSVRVGTLSVADNRFTTVYKGAGAFATVAFLTDGEFAVTVFDAPELRLYRVRPGHSVQKMGSTRLLIPPNTTVTSVSLSNDFAKAFVVTREDRRDVWMAKVVR